MNSRHQEACLNRCYFFQTAATITIDQHNSVGSIFSFSSLYGFRKPFVQISRVTVQALVEEDTIRRAYTEVLQFIPENFTGNDLGARIEAHGEDFFCTCLL